MPLVKRPITEKTQYEKDSLSTTHAIIVIILALLLGIFGDFIYNHIFNF